jgi:Flp pilus assembly protein TadD
MFKKYIMIGLSLTLIITAIVFLAHPKSGSEEIKGDAKINNETGLNYYKEARFELEAKGKTAEAANKYAEAEAQFKKAIAINPNYAEAHSNLARVYHFQKKYSEEAIEYEMVVKLRPHDIEAHVNLASAYGLNRRHDDAIQQLKKAVSLSPDDATRKMLKGFIEGLERDKQK